MGLEIILKTLIDIWNATIDLHKQLHTAAYVNYTINTYPIRKYVLVAVPLTNIAKQLENLIISYLDVNGTNDINITEIKRSLHDIASEVKKLKNNIKKLQLFETKLVDINEYKKLNLCLTILEQTLSEYL